MATSITTINATDYQDDSRTVINDNFSSLNTNKVEKGGDTMTGQLSFSGTGHAGLKLNSLTTSQRDALTPALGMVIENTTIGELQRYNGSAWVSLGAFETGDLTWSTRTSKTGWLKCDGSAVSRVTYADLFSLLSTTYGVGDGSTTFNLPNIAGRVLMGAGTGTIVATFASRASNVITVTGLTDIASNEFQTGQAVVYHTSGSVITGLSNDTTYYLVRTGNLTFSLASSLANAVAGTVISLSSDGTGTQTFTLSLSARTLGDRGGEESHSLTVEEIPAHTHSATYPVAPDNNQGFAAATTSTDASATGSTGGSTTHNNVQPYLVENLFIKY